MICYIINIPEENKDYGYTRLLDLYYLANKLAECYFIMLAGQKKVIYLLI